MKQLAFHSKKQYKNVSKVDKLLHSVSCSTNWTLSCLQRVGRFQTPDKKKQGLHFKAKRTLTGGFLDKTIARSILTTENAATAFRNEIS